MQGFVDSFCDNFLSRVFSIAAGALAWGFLGTGAAVMAEMFLFPSYKTPVFSVSACLTVFILFLIMFVIGTAWALSRLRDEMTSILRAYQETVQGRQRQESSDEEDEVAIIG